MDVYAVIEFGPERMRRLIDRAGRVAKFLNVCIEIVDPVHGIAIWALVLADSMSLALAADSLRSRPSNRQKRRGQRKNPSTPEALCQIQPLWRTATQMFTYLLIALGGGVGSVARYAASAAIARGPSEIFPWGTLAVNVTGCFIIGLFAMLTGPDGRILVPPDFRQFFMVGVCGGYTTFSSFSLQTLALARDGDMTRAGLNAGGSVLLCLIGVWLGSAAGAAVNQIKGA